MVVTDALDIGQIRELFPILGQRVYGNKALVYLDNAATTHKPLSVIRKAQCFYEQENANIHRGMYAIASQATTALEATRSAVQKFLHAPKPATIVFTAGTTASINLIAATYGEMVLGAGDEVLVSVLEHHSNFVPWQLLCKRKNASLKLLPIDDTGQLDLTQLDQWITKRTKIVALTYVSNAIGTITPIKAIIEQAHAKGAIVVVDGAQAVAHLPIDVAALDCDFFVFSAHKMYGLTGLGVLYGKEEWLERMPPYQAGGGMVDTVRLETVTYQAPPYKFEAGTLPLASIISFSEAIEWLLRIGYAKLAKQEATLVSHALKGLSHIAGIQLIGTAAEKIGIIAFNLSNRHHLDVGLLLDAQGIAVRTGHCCTQPLMHRLGIEGVVRLSFAIYNTLEEIDLFLEALHKIIQKGY
ncbi:aminotransferase class V-fold PLP-dependent enzyme [Candidatus Cardinium hertigii]|uniref:Cysteine desulfurase n=1 Tax=Candidatus Cardinium hertigii TaxID=247481 RepID=A0A2Z3L7I3_9BACT|nr:SufS family cysteine desulfurase [Candidatus Cardinium hertigii]AWN81409.1 Cysteine desulfurase [Candidatus Cardinium hertigii]